MKKTTTRQCLRDSSIVHIMLFSLQQQQQQQCQLWLAVVLMFGLANACNIWKASDCPKPPTADDEEIVRTRHATLPSECVPVN